MPDLKVLPPKLKIDINLELRLRVLSGVLFELTSICGVDIKDSLSKGIIERDIIDKIICTFQDVNGKSYGNIEFLIDWDKLEVMTKMDDNTKEVFKGIDFSNGYCNALDHRMLKVLKLHVEKLKKSYKISKVICSFNYREKYRTTDEIFKTAIEYMGHALPDKSLSYELDAQFCKSLEATFKGLDNILKVVFKFN